MSRKRKGMIIKNTNDRAVLIDLATRSLRIGPGDEFAITAEEVKDPALREHLQVRAVSIVRPTTDAEEEELRRCLAEDQQRAE